MRKQDLVKDLRWYADRWDSAATTPFGVRCLNLMRQAATELEQQNAAELGNERKWTAVYIEYESADGLSDTRQWFGKLPTPSRLTRVATWRVNFEKFETHTPPPIRQYEFSGFSIKDASTLILHYREVLA